MASKTWPLIAEAEELRQRRALAEKVEALQNLLLAKATRDYPSDELRERSEEYVQLRHGLLADRTIGDRLPSFVRTCRNLTQFREVVAKFPRWHERRAFIRAGFQPLLDALEGKDTTPADEQVGDVLAGFDTDAVHRVWERALDRRKDDPEGAITSARTLLETVCKHILDDAGVAYAEKDDLPKLYRIVSQHLQLAPSQHSEPVLKQILGGCTAIVEGLGALRNRLSDAHGKGKKQAKPSARHAELAVNLAGAMAVFLIETWETRKT